MSKNIENEVTNETHPKSQKGYSLRERTSSKKNTNYIKLNYDGENSSYDSSHLKKKKDAQLNILHPVQIILNAHLMDVKKNSMIVRHFISIN